MLSAGPIDGNVDSCGVFGETEMHQRFVASFVSVPGRRHHNTHRIAGRDAHSRADRISFATSADQFKLNEVILRRRAILQQHQWFFEIADRDVELAVAIVIGPDQTSSKMGFVPVVFVDLSSVFKMVAAVDQQLSWHLERNSGVAEVIDVSVDD